MLASLLYSVPFVGDEIQVRNLSVTAIWWGQMTLIKVASVLLMMRTRKIDLSCSSEGHMFVPPEQVTSSVTSFRTCFTRFVHRWETVIQNYSEVKFRVLGSKRVGHEVSHVETGLDV
ncbi:hypothetical protein TNCV_1288301 [Trichonephila clavipes]|nr:hypothetical protein TNCV_1288301 [Trichonephila clavipes]